jgi:hypothetical protein
MYNQEIVTVVSLSFNGTDYLALTSCLAFLFRAVPIFPINPFSSLLDIHWSVPLKQAELSHFASGCGNMRQALCTYTLNSRRQRVLTL